MSSLPPAHKNLAGALVKVFTVCKVKRMVNTVENLQPPERIRQNPLKLWRQGQVLRDEAGRECMLSIGDAAARAGTNYSTYYSWECWPDDHGKMPGAAGLVVIERLTGGAVSANDFIAVYADRQAA